MPSIPLFAPVCVDLRAGFAYGQLLQTSARGMTVRIGSETTLHSRRSVFEVAPALCFLLVAKEPRFSGALRAIASDYHARIWIDCWARMDPMRLATSARFFMEFFNQVTNRPSMTQFYGGALALLGMF